MLEQIILLLQDNRYCTGICYNTAIGLVPNTMLIQVSNGKASISRVDFRQLPMLDVQHDRDNGSD